MDKKKRKPYSGKELLEIQKFVNSEWGKRAVLNLVRLHETLKEMEPFYFKPGPHQEEYYQAYSDIIGAMKRWKHLSPFGKVSARSHWHYKQLSKYNQPDISKTRFRNSSLNLYEIDYSKRSDGKLALFLLDNDDNIIKTVYSDNKRYFCDCGCLVLAFHKKRVEWYCPECGKVEPSFTNVNERATNEKWKWESRPPKNWKQNWKKAPKKYQKTIRMLRRDSSRGHHQINKDDQAMIVTRGFVKQELNLKQYQINEIVSLINKLNYSKLYGNRSKTVDETMKTVCICLYALEKMGEPKRIGRNKFLLGLGLTNDIYKVIKERIDSQLLDN